MQKCYQKRAQQILKPQQHWPVDLHVIEYKYHRKQRIGTATQDRRQLALYYATEQRFMEIGTLPPTMSKIKNDSSEEAPNWNLCKRK